VRRDEADRAKSASRCSSPAGASPVSVSTGAPSSRPQASVERPMARAGCREPLRREPARGPQHQVKPAASTDSQSESRADHVAAKATSAASPSGATRAAGLGGVWGAARVHGDERNTRGPCVKRQDLPMTTMNEFMNAPYPARQDQAAAVWRAMVDQHRTVAVIQYAGEDTFVARATYSDAGGSRGITTYHHRSRQAATREAIRLSQVLRP
jgi:hypothetical protein